MEVEEFGVIVVEAVEADEFVAVGDDAVVRVHAVRRGVLVVLVIEGGAPVGGARAAKDREEAVALHALGDGLAGGGEEGLGEIEIRDDVLAHGAGLRDAGPADEERRAHGFLEDPALVEPAVLAEVEALVAGVDDDGVFREALLLEVIEHAAHALIDGADGGEVVVHVALVFPADEVLAGEIGGAELGVARLVVGIPHLPLLGGEAGRGDELGVAVDHGLVDRHVLIVLGGAAARVVVEEGGRLVVHAVVVGLEVAQGGLPLTVRGLVLTHEEEGLGLVALGEPVEGDIGDDVGDVAGILDGLAHADHGRIIVDTLAGEDLPEIEAGGIGAEMPLANDRGLVAGLLENLRKRGLRAIEADAAGIVVEAVDVIVGAGEHGGAAGPADGVGHETAVEAHALLRDAVDVRRIEQLAGIAVGAESLVGVVVGKDEDDVGGGGGRGARDGGGGHEQAGEDEAAEGEERAEEGGAGHGVGVEFGDRG